jgi:hypothetical protein
MRILVPWCFAGLIGLTSLAVPAVSSGADEVTLTQDEADTVKLILRKDKMMEQMVKSQKGMEALARIMNMTITGPVKLAVQWNQAAIV